MEQIAVLTWNDQTENKMVFWLQGQRAQLFFQISNLLDAGIDFQVKMTTKFEADIK